MYFTSFVIRSLVLKDLSFSISCEYFLFYYLIIFCLLLPTKVFVDLILIFILKVDIKFYTEYFTMDKLTIILISCILSLTFKSIVSLFIYIGATKTNYFFYIFKSLKSYRLPNFTTIISNKQILSPRLWCVIPPILGVELPYSNTKNEDTIFKNTDKYESIRELKRKGFKEYPLYNLLLPSSFTMDQ
jgi:ABC-type Fe3+-siderophore transport system permease subunit